MKFKQCIPSALTVALIASPGFAQQPQGQPQGQGQTQPQGQTQQTGEQTEQQRQQQEQARVGQQQPGMQQILRADRLMGQTVRDRQDERLGRINDLALDTQEGRVTYAVVNRGGMWGIGGEEVAVAWEQIQPDQQQRVVRIDQAQLQQAREIDRRRDWPGAFGDDAAVGAGADRQHRIVPMSNVVGMDVNNRQGNRLGTIHDLAIERDGSVAYAVISYGGFLGMGDNHVAVPWDRLSMDRERQSLLLDVTEQQLEQAQQQQRFGERREDAWPNRVDWPFGAGGANR